jgi:hypothetical protein
MSKLYHFSFDFCYRCPHGANVQKPDDADWKTKTNTACTFKPDKKEVKNEQSTITI